MKVEVNRNAEVYILMEDYMFRFEPQEIENRWAVYKKPKDLYDLIRERLDIIEKEKRRYEDEMLEEQEKYRKTFESTEKVIRNFHTNNAVSSHGSIIKMCSEVMQTLATLNEQSRKFNSREILFGREQTDYQRLQTVTKDFTPYNTLWSIVHRWYTDIDDWMDSQFNTIDANAAEKFVEESFRSIVTANKYFKDRSMGQIVSIGEKVRQEMDKFKPNLPLMVALRKDGMKERHWAEVSKLAQIDINPDEEGFNFRKVLTMGLIKHVDACV
jgi:dynein heavy chain